MSASVHTAEKPVKATTKTPKRAKKRAAPTVSAPPTTWDELIAQFEEEPGLETIAALAREKRDDGMGLREFCELMLDGFKTAKVHTDLNAVFELSDADDWDMSQSEVELALERLRAGDTPQEAYLAVKRAAGSQDGAEAGWIAARDAFQAIRRDRILAGANHDPKWAAFFAKLPPEIVAPSLHYDAHLRWSSIKELEDDPLVSRAEFAELAPKLEAALEDFKAFLRGKNLPSDEDEDELYDREFSAEKAWLLAETPALQAVTYKIRHVSRENDDNKMGIDEPSYAAVQAEDWAGQQQLSVLRDLLKIAGEYHPILDPENVFSPSAFIDGWRDRGGAVTTYNGALLLCHPPFMTGDEAAEIEEELAYLSERPWRFHAVHMTAENRRMQGGDPVFRAFGERRTPELKNPSGWRISRVTRVSFTRGPVYFPGSVAEHGVKASVEVIDLGPHHPTEDDISRATGDNVEWIRSVATLTEAGAAALAAVDTFAPEAWLDAFNALPDHYYKPKFGPEFRPDNDASRASWDERSPAFQKWCDLAPWQRAALNRASLTRPDRDDVQLAARRIWDSDDTGEHWQGMVETAVFSPGSRFRGRPGLDLNLVGAAILDQLAAWSASPNAPSSLYSNSADRPVAS